MCVHRKRVCVWLPRYGAHMTHDTSHITHHTSTGINWRGVLQGVAVCCRRVAVCYSVLHYNTLVFYSVLQCVEVCGSVLQCVAVCCSVLQCVAVYASICTMNISHMYHRCIVCRYIHVVHGVHTHLEQPNTQYVQIH